MRDDRSPLHGMPEDLDRAREMIEELRRELARQAEIIHYLEDASRELRVLTQSSPSAIIALDPEGIVTAWNPAAERLFGWSSVEVVGQPYPLVPEEEFPAFQRLLYANLHGRPASRHIVHRQTKQGVTRPVSLETAALRDDEGMIIGVVGILTDITEALAAEAEQSELAAAHQAALALVATLRGLLPICDRCEKIRGEDGVWRSLEDHAGAVGGDARHVFCPDCAGDREPPSEDG